MAVNYCDINPYYRMKEAFFEAVTHVRLNFGSFEECMLLMV